MFSITFGAQCVPSYSPGQQMHYSPLRKNHKHQAVVGCYVTSLLLLFIFICKHLFSFLSVKFGGYLFKLAA